MPYAAQVAQALDRLALPSSPSPRPVRVVRPEPPPTVFVTTPSALEAACQALASQPAVGLDTETTGLTPRQGRLRLVQLGVPEAAYVVDVWQVGDLSPLRRLLASPRPHKVVQNARFDLAFLSQEGLGEVEGLFDPMLAAQLLAAGEEGASVGLASLVARYLGLTLHKTLQNRDWSGEIHPAQLRYAALDVSLLVPLAQRLEGELMRAGLARVAALEMQAIPAVADLCATGMSVDLASLGRAMWARERKAQDLEDRLRSLLPPGKDGPPHLASPAQVRDSLARLGLDVPDAREETLSRFAHRPEVEAYLAWRRVQKRLAFLQGLERTVVSVGEGWGRVYPDWWQLGTASGRMSCSQPNLQQVPRDGEIRALFAAPPGKALVVADYSQMELRLVAALSGDARMLAAFRAGEDLHRLTASLLTGKPPQEVSSQERQAAKAANFGLVYAMGSQGLSAYARSAFGVDMSLEEAQGMRQRFFAAYPGVRAWQERAWREAQAQGEVRTRTGRRRLFPHGVRPQDACNAPVQGLGADILKLALGRLVRRLRPLGAHLTAAVHDEVVVECPAPAAETVREVVAQVLTESAQELVPEVPMPCTARVASTWAEKEG
jgi:DNA polymerase-1